MRLLKLIVILVSLLLPIKPHAQTATGVAFSNTTPAAPNGGTNILWQHDSSYPNANISAYVPAPPACATAATITAPCTVYQSGVVSASSLTTYATVFTTSVQGVYVLNCNIYATTASSTAFVINLDYSAHLLNAAGNSTGLCSSSTIGITAIPLWNTTNLTGILAPGVTIQIGTYVGSGSNTGGAWNYAVIIERLQ